MLTEAASAISGIKGALDIAKGLNAALTRAEALEIQAELLQRLSQASMDTITTVEAYRSARQECDKLQIEIDKINAWDVDAQKYTLQAVGQKAARAFLPEGVENDLKSGQWHCPDCFYQKRKSLLHLRDLGQYAFLFCNHCKLELDVMGRRGPSGRTRSINRA